MAEGAGLIMNYHTGHFALIRRGGIEAGETLLVHGAGGGTGTAAIQIGKAVGARVLAVASDEAKRKAATDAGADEVIDAAGEWRESVKELTGGRGADVIFDPVGGDRFDQSIRALAPEGRLIVIGFTSGRIPSVTVNRLLFRNTSVVGAAWGHFALERPEYFRQVASDLERMIADGFVKPVLGNRYPLAQASTSIDRARAAPGAREDRPRHQGVRPMSRFEDPVMISCSISGAVANRDQCGAIPYTPEEYAAEARRAVDEGASQIHIHARTPDGVPSYEIEDFRAITQAILGEVGDVIINYSTGAIGVPLEKRLEYLRALKPEVAALNMSSMNYAKFSKRRGEFVFKAVFENSFDLIEEFIDEMNEIGIQPEHECFDTGHVANLDPFLTLGKLSPPLQISLVMGVVGGVRPTPRNLATMTDQIPEGPEGPNNWQLIGISRDQWRLIGTALALGGNVRAGLEDNFYLPDGEMARSNGDLIAKARQMAEDVGRRAATVEEARQMLGLPAPDRSGLEVAV